MRHKVIVTPIHTSHWSKVCTAACTFSYQVYFFSLHPNVIVKMFIHEALGPCIARSAVHLDHSRGCQLSCGVISDASTSP